MTITDYIRSPGDGKIVFGYVSFVFDDLYRVNDFRIIKRANGSLFLSPPQKKVSIACTVCGRGNRTDANYCNECGKRLSIDCRLDRFYDIFHPINQKGRDLLERAVFGSSLTKTSRSDTY